jgi:hypothetical protein
MRNAIVLMIALFVADVANATQLGGTGIQGDSFPSDISVTGNITGAGSTTFKSYHFQVGNSGTYYMAGSYEAPAAEAVLNQGNITQTYGAANNAYGAHVFLVAKAAGTATGGSGAVTIVVSGISITDAGVRNGADNETLVADITALATNQYVETSKKWLGQVTYTLTVGGTGHTAYAASFNYGRAKYDDFGNRSFTVTDTECAWEAVGNETNLGIRFLHHDSSNWTYSAAAFVPGGTVINTLDTDYSTDDEFDTGEYGAYKRSGLSEAVAGDSSEGVIIELSTAVNNTVDNIDCHIGVTF